MDKQKTTGSSPYQHIKRLGIVAACLFVVLFGVRALLKPKTFGQFGHYRGAAIDEIRAKTPNHVGKTACTECHEEVRDTASAGKHGKMSCDTCHGPMAAHADDQTPENSKVVFTDRECLRCHRQLAARPKFMPQVNDKSHFSKETCQSCHSPHNPRPHASAGKLKTAAAGKE